MACGARIHAGTRIRGLRTNPSSRLAVMANGLAPIDSEALSGLARS
jgi:hypothetical protein